MDKYHIVCRMLILFGMTGVWKTVRSDTTYEIPTEENTAVERQWTQRSKCCLRLESTHGFSLNITFCRPTSLVRVKHAKLLSKAPSNDNEFRWFHLANNDNPQYTAASDHCVRYLLLFDNYIEPCGLCKWKVFNRTAAITGTTEETTLPFFVTSTQPQATTTTAITTTTATSTSGATTEIRMEPCTSASTESPSTPTTSSEPTTSSTVTSAITTEVPDLAANSTCLCPCVCMEPLNQVQIEETFHEMLDNLAVEKRGTSKTKRKCISVPDERTSCKSIAAVGLIIVATVFGIILLSDAELYYRHVKEAVQFTRPVSA